jgi:hypothetical protein
MLHEIVSALLDCFSQIWFILLALSLAWLMQMLVTVMIREAERDLRRLQRRLYSQQVALEISEIKLARIFRSAA